MSVMNLSPSAARVLTGRLHSPVGVVVEETSPSPVEPRPRSASFSASKGFPSVVLAGPSPPSSSSAASQHGSGPEFFADDTSVSEAERAWASRQQRGGGEQARLGQGGILQPMEARTPKEGTVTERTSPTCMSNCPRSPSSAAGRYEEAMEAQTGPGNFSPTCFYSNGSIAPNDVGAGRSHSMVVWNEVDGAHLVGISDDLPVVEDDSWAKKEKNTPVVAVTPSKSPSLQLFANRTNESCIQYGKPKALLAPVGINTSHSSESQQCAIHYRKDIFSSTIAGGGDELPRVQKSPLSFIVTTGGSASGRKTRGMRNGSEFDTTERRGILHDNAQRRGEAGEEPVLLSAVLDRGWGSMCEEDVAFWKRRCILAEQKLAVAVQRISEHFSSTAATAGSQSCTSSPPEEKESSNCTTLVSEVGLGNKHLRKAPPQNQVESVRLWEGNGEMKATSNTVTTRGATSGAVVPKNRPKKVVESKIDNERTELENLVTRLRLERDTLKDELNKQTVRNEDLETRLLAKEEQQEAQREEWLTQKEKLREKQEQLAVALRQAHLNVSSTAEQIGQREEELQTARTLRCAAEAELAAVNKELREMKKTNERQLEDGRKLQMQLKQLEADNQSYGSKNVTETSKNDSRDYVILRGALLERTEQQLQRVLAALQRGEARRTWVASQLSEVMKCVNATWTEKEDFLSVETKVQQLVHSLEALVGSRMKVTNDGWETPTIEDVTCDKPLMTTGADCSAADLLSLAQEGVSRLELWSDAFQQRYFELKEELKVVRADRNELVGQQSQRVRNLQQQLLTAEQEVTRLMLSIGERDETIRRMKEESRVVMPSQEPTSTVAPPSRGAELQAAREKIAAMQAAHRVDLERVVEHMGQQAEEFGRTLQAAREEAMEMMMSSQREELELAERRNSAMQEQLQRLREEREMNRRVQDECLGALRSQLNKTRGELAAKEGALRIALQVQLGQSERWRQQLSNEREVHTPEALVVSPTTPGPIVTSIPSLTNDKRNEGTPLEPAEELLVPETRRPGAILACEEAEPSRPTVRGPSARRTVTFSPDVIFVEDHQTYSTSSSSGGLASRSPSSSGSSASSPGADSGERHDSGHVIHRGVMRRHQEVWMQQAELMGIPPGEE
ncbi:hypothetical protein DQ04_00171110 [Trypanosoma grayi]|uniref:hypothetical protein n=1 Tax=Trypanosoma grayi TaxID=71804 RepID=UPI0004F4B6A1|nr:hypothetical protein DQ04_00171110 [Trypanosoma grayi]KEG15147.1 hypothetical protein DQ04_00171110 [Trypanosoma grayi]